MRLIFFISLILLIPTVEPAKAQVDTNRMMIIGRNALFFEDYIVAIQYFNQVISAKPFLSEPYYLRAVGKYNLDDLKGALVDVDQALYINPFLVDAYILRGAIHQEIGNSDEALSDFNKGLEIDPGNVNLIMNIGIINITNKNYTQAIANFTEALSLRPNLVPALLNRGHARFASNDTLGSLEDFTAAIELDPDIPDGYANRAMVFYFKNEFDKALSDLNHAITLSPNEARLFMNRGIIRYQMDDLRGTVADFDRVIELEPRNAVAFSNRGILRAQVGDTNRAIDDFSRVLALNRDDILTLYYRALLYSQIGELNKALADFNIVADNYPDFAPVFFNRAQVRNQLGDRRGAENDYLTAVRLDLARTRKIDQQPVVTSTSGDNGNDLENENNREERKATRRASDRDIHNYNRIAVLDDFGTGQHQEVSTNPLRGRIQDRDVAIELEQAFGLTFFPGDTLVHRFRYFDLNVEAINRERIINKQLTLSNVERVLSTQQADSVLLIIRDLTSKIEQAGNQEKELLLFVRGALHIAMMNLNNALDDYNQVIEINPSNFLAYFNRAHVRLKMINLLQNVKESVIQPPQLSRLDNFNQTLYATPRIEHRILDFDLIISDLEKVLELEPRFAFANFNLGTVKVLQQDYDGAITYFTQAINSSSNFAEAFFNRGLTRIFLNEEAAGTLDLSKAGELGIFKAYNIIRRYGASRQPATSTNVDNEDE